MEKFVIRSRAKRLAPSNSSPSAKGASDDLLLVYLFVRGTGFKAQPSSVTYSYIDDQILHCFVLISRQFSAV